MVRLLAHDPVPHDLGQHRGGRHRGALGVAVDDGPHRAVEGILGMAQQVDRAVDEEGLGRLDRARPGRDGPPPAAPRSSPTRRTRPARRARPTRPGTTPRPPRRSPRGAPRSAFWSPAATPAWTAAARGDARRRRRRSAGRPRRRGPPRRGPRPTHSPASAGAAPPSGRANRPSSGHPRVRLVRWGREHGRGGNHGGTVAVAVGAGDEGRRAQPLPGHLGARASRSPRSPTRGTASAACPTAASWASCSHGTTFAGSGRVRASGGTEALSPSGPSARLRCSRRSEWPRASAS